MPLSSQFPWQFRLMAYLRVPILMFIVIPISFLLWVWEIIWGKIHSYIKRRGTHEERVKILIDAIKRWHEEVKKTGKAKKMRTDRAGWAAMSTKLSSNKENSLKIPVWHLDNILNIDTRAKTITAEPAVNMGRLTEALLPKGYSLEIHPEMESLTLGGLSMGFGMETNSHTVGFFQETVLKYEMVTSEGKVLQITATSDPDLFYAMPWSYGTIGFLTAITIRIVPVKPYVHMTYVPCSTLKELRRTMCRQAECENPPDFLEATIYSPTHSVVQIGRRSEKPTDTKKINSINWWWKPFYYKWVETYLHKRADEDMDEYIPLKHYYHRFTRSIFWELEDMIPFSNHPIYRFFWGWMGAPRVSLLKLFQGPVIRRSSIYAHVVQESIVPLKIIDECISKFDKWFGVYPLLAFPLRIYDRGNHSGFLNPRGKNILPGKNYGIWCDIGAYGPPRRVKEGKFWDAKLNIREMEHWTRSVGGFQATYTDLFCTPTEFREMFDHSLLDAQRKRFNALEAFPEVYDKIKPEKGLIDLSEELKEEREKCEKNVRKIQNVF